MRPAVRLIRPSCGDDDMRAGPYPVSCMPNEHSRYMHPGRQRQSKRTDSGEQRHATYLTAGIRAPGMRDAMGRGTRFSTTRQAQAPHKHQFVLQYERPATHAHTVQTGARGSTTAGIRRQTSECPYSTVDDRPWPPVSAGDRSRPIRTRPGHATPGGYFTIGPTVKYRTGYLNIREAVCEYPADRRT